MTNGFRKRKGGEKRERKEKGGRNIAFRLKGRGVMIRLLNTLGGMKEKTLSSNKFMGERKANHIV